MKPVIILPCEAMSKEDIELLRANDICVVEADDPDAVRFMEPPPSGDYDVVDRGAIELGRWILAQSPTDQYTCTVLVAKLARAIVLARQQVESQSVSSVPQITRAKKTK